MKLNWLFVAACFYILFGIGLCATAGWAGFAVWAAIGSLVSFATFIAVYLEMS